MKFTFLDSGTLWDVIFVVILIVCVSVSAKKGAFSALSGIAGSVLGVVLGNVFQSAVSPLIERLISPTIRNLVGKADLSAATGIEEGSVLNTLIHESTVLSDKLNDAYHALLERISQHIAACLAPILAFLLIFLVTKLLIFLICKLLGLGIPVVSQLNHTAGAILGVVSGVLIVGILCWAVLRFAPADNVSLFSQNCLKSSFFGSRICALFV